MQQRRTVREDGAGVVWCWKLLTKSAGEDNRQRRWRKTTYDVADFLERITPEKFRYIDREKMLFKCGWFFRGRGRRGKGRGRRWRWVWEGEGEKGVAGLRGRGKGAVAGWEGEGEETVGFERESEISTGLRGTEVGLHTQTLEKKKEKRINIRVFYV